MIDILELKWLFENHYKGYFNRVSLKTLCDYFKVNSTREIRRLIHQLRLRGSLIVSHSKGRGGYWLTTRELIDTDDNERAQVEIMIKELNSRIGRISEIKKPFDKLLARENDQILMTY
jgi:hypothetical protein